METKGACSALEPHAGAQDCRRGEAGVRGRGRLRTVGGGRPECGGVAGSGL
jgi:hypothetical protein